MVLRVDVTTPLLRLVHWVVHCVPIPVVVAASLVCRLLAVHATKMKARTLAQGLTCWLVTEVEEEVEPLFANARCR
jgi:hypothetical protein